jgi:hypothetical protein
MLIPLEGPSISAEFFYTLGLVICGLNPKRKTTEVHIYNTKKQNWTVIDNNSLSFE